jgi:hypothetical protein
MGLSSVFSRRRGTSRFLCHIRMYMPALREMPRPAMWALVFGCSMLTGCGGRDADPQGDAGTWVGDPGTGDGGFVMSPTHRYRLGRSAEAVLAPSPDPTSFTFDGHDYWFLYGKDTKSGGRVVELDPVTSTIARDWSVPALLVDSPNAVFGGIAWDGEAVWIGTSGVGATVFRIAVSGAAEKGWKVQGDGGPSALAFDGMRLWVSSGVGEVDALNPVDGRLQASFLIKEHSARQGGVAFRTGELWVSALFGGIDVYDPVNGVRWDSVLSKDGVAEHEFVLGSIAFVGHRLGSLQGSRVVLYDVEALR